jgi:DDE superfamily endonuclease
MLSLPHEMIAVLQPFAPAFSKRVWERVKVLIVGALLTPGQRTVAAALRVMGLDHDAHFGNYHRVLSRARWASLALCPILLRLLLDAFVAPAAPVVVGIDEHIERRRGAKIAAKGIYRDPVRSSKEFFVKTSGLRWISLQLLAPIPWVQQVWALPFLTVLAPSERYHQKRHLRHKTITDWGRQMILQLRRWLPDRAIIVVADSAYAVLELLARCQRLPHPVTVVTRLRLDAALYDPPPERTVATRGRPRKKGKRQSTLQTRLSDPLTDWQEVVVGWYGGGERAIEIATGTAVWYHGGMPTVPLRWVLIRDPAGEFDPQALLCTDQEVAAPQVVEWFVLRWHLEVTFHEARAHLGVETQRQWSDLAIARTTPALLGLFSLVTLVARELAPDHVLPTRQAAWYDKDVPTFADTLAVVRQHLWPVAFSELSFSNTDFVKIPRVVLERFTTTLAYAA